MIPTTRSLALAGALLVALSPTTASAQKTVRFVAQADLRVLDPIWTTAYITRNHGYMVHDTLFALDKDLKPQPQMVDAFTVAPDKLTYRFTLRAGLKWHDGQPVTAADCVASIQRWGKRDPLGQKLLEAVANMTATDERSFTIALKEPFPLLIEGLAKLSSNTPFMFPERLAKTDAMTQITESIGSGPFKFVKDEWVPGNKVVYVKNVDYVPRSEPPSFAAGGKAVKVDRVDWLYIPDGATQAAALQSGEVDWIEQPPVDLLPTLAKNPEIVIDNIDPLGNQGVLRFNHIQPPFNNVKLRQALLYLIDQTDTMRAIAGAEKNWKACAAMFGCDTPLASNVGAEALLGPRSLEKAKALIKESGYNNERIVIISATDQPVVHGQATVTTETLKRAGLNIDLQAMDWGTLISRRTSKEPVDKGGWSIFHTWVVAPDVLTPALNNAVRASGDGAWFGWPSDAKLEELRAAWLKAPDLEAQKKLAAAIQERAYEIVSYIPTGQFLIPTAYRKTLKGLIVAPVVFLWNVEKE
ncbi:MAG: ABC transporter substrate-binding protein [Proteobacteria bacterium]|nr:ABC transporter substrate-binding protein [Pseudomonadota bacterium]MBI3498645.1 ABC transporter substrate-binding protein [Pseudomonadota bacterium]